MDPSTPGPATESTWRPSGSAYSVPAAPKGSALGAQGANGVARRRSRLVMSLVLQGVLALLMLAAAYLTIEAPRTMRLYLWSVIIPVGFGLVFWRAYARGERERSAGSWTIAWERREARRAFQLLGVVALVWAFGIVTVALVL